MKKIILGIFTTVLFATSSFASTSTFEKINKISPKKEIKKVAKKVSNNTKKEETICSVTCTITQTNGITYTATAGNWFSSCSGAASRCADKLVAMNNWE